jgi:heme-degrading monooxygenase HmoA
MLDERDKGGDVVLEMAVLNVVAGEEPGFEAAMNEARPLIAATPGFEGIEVRRCMETANRYLLLVRWASLEAHTVGFRESERFPRWRELLHHFYDPAPLVQHYGASFLIGE